MMQTDNQFAVQRAIAYLPDSRVHHFWDLWRFGGRTYKNELLIPETEVWDLFVFYKPKLVWEKAAPNPTFWMTARNLKVGRQYKKQDLELELSSWMN